MIIPLQRYEAGIGNDISSMREYHDRYLIFHCLSLLIFMYEPYYHIPDLATHVCIPSGSFRLVFADSNGSILCTADKPVVSDHVPDVLADCVSSPILIGSIPEINWMVHPIFVSREIPQPYEMIPLRSIASMLPRDLLGILGRAIHLVRFDDTTAFCGRCVGRRTC